MVVVVAVNTSLVVAAAGALVLLCEGCISGWSSEVAVMLHLVAVAGKATVNAAVVVVVGHWCCCGGQRSVGEW